MVGTDTKSAKTGFSFPPRGKNAQRLLLFCLLFVAVAAALTAAFVVIPSRDYSDAKKLLNNGDYDAAMDAFAKIYNYRDSAALYSRAATETGDACLSRGDTVGAAVYFTKAGRSLEAEQIFDFNSVVTGTSFVTAAISQDGESYYLSDREGDNRREGVAAVASYSRFLPNSPGINGLDKFGFIRLHSPGSYGVSLSEEVAAELTAASGVRDMISMLTDDGYTGYTVVLFNDGRVKVFSDAPNPLTGVSGWRDIVSVRTGYRKVFGLDSSGRLRIAYETGYPQEPRYDVSGWKDVQKVVETGKAIVGLTRAGQVTVAYAGTERAYPKSLTFIKDATDIATNSNLLLVLRANGSVKAIRVPNWTSDNESSADKYLDKMAAAVNRWTGVTRIRFAAKGIYGIRFNGTARYISCDVSFDTAKRTFLYNEHEDFAAQVSRWTDIVDVISCGTHAVGIRADGTLSAVGDGSYLESRVGTSGATDYIRREGGTYLNVDTWHLW